MSFTEDEYAQVIPLYLLPGMKVKLEIVFDLEDNKGVRPLGGKSGTYNNKSLNRGFLVLDDAVGKIEDVPGDEDSVAVHYVHQKSEPNDIVFFGDRPDIRGGIIKVCFRVISVPIHDHSSIVQGGPAYGTYYSDNEVD